MRWTYNWGEEDKKYGVLVGKIAEKLTLGRRRDNIKMDVRNKL